MKAFRAYTGSANASRFVEDVLTLTGPGDPVRWLVLDGAAIGDVDYTASGTLSRVIGELHQRHIRVVITSLMDAVHSELSHYGITGSRGPDAYYDTPGAVLEAFHAEGPEA